ncbi:PREDICTED: uncharacterized protein LOC106121850 [Papilio xuthus]|uniref:Uncharacterized protein LOC106121850 n=1 Tax=Papilio xuthus TaxID=66420 RepID=A0AAJ6ZIL2_PAPXU|nr:PREDICTED: uncharacterized protein LOC106121850 [Papilio xuthus]
MKKAGSETFNGFIKSCSGDSPECLKEFLQSVLEVFLNGIPELGIKCLDPFEFENLQFNLPSGLQIKFVNGNATGFKSCIFDSVRNIGNNYELTSHCNLTIQGRYKSSGRMLIFPVNGEGDSTIKCSRIEMKTSIQLIPKLASNGREHIEISKIKSTHTFKEQVSYNFTNIFKGNPVLSKMVLDFMNKNWLMVAEEFGDPIVKYGIEEILNNVNKLFRSLPSDRLILLTM